ncbi:MAG: hypothetical protein DYG98_17350 [Haliscomenobacteraceae bacterium CHB4]|nr:hypothetical protein [Haliscomenobacteraceae bacterium CHB4]
MTIHRDFFANYFPPGIKQDFVLRCLAAPDMTRSIRMDGSQRSTFLIYAVFQPVHLAVTYYSPIFGRRKITGGFMFM